MFLWLNYIYNGIRMENKNILINGKLEVSVNHNNPGYVIIHPYMLIYTLKIIRYIALTL